MRKRIVLCADDYGQAPAISQGILALVKSNRLSAVSCMVTTPYWPEHAKWLAPFAAEIDVGLHFNLTEGKTSLSTLMTKSILRQLDPGVIITELNSQIDAFTEAMGVLPSFIDGHQHVHQFPVIREALISVYQDRLRDHKPYIRVINGRSRNLKKIVAQALGTRALTKLLVRNEIPHNQSFSGMYSFKRSGNYQGLFPGFLSEIGDRGLVMCHPGLPGSGVIDPIAMTRYLEYQYLSSLRFQLDCKAQNVIIGRFV